MGCVESLQAKIGGLTTTIADHQDGNLIGTGPTGSADASAPTRRPWQMALSLERLQEERFVGFNDAAFARCTMSGGLLQETMAPEKRRVFVDPAAAGGGTYAHPIDQGLGMAQPLVALA